jgi:hypothetical protein
MTISELINALLSAQTLLKNDGAKVVVVEDQTDQMCQITDVETIVSARTNQVRITFA